MTKRRNIIPTVPLTTYIPEDVMAKATLFLFSPAEGKVPYGAYQGFFTRLIREFFDHKLLDLAPWAGTDPGACVVRASPETLAILEKTLKGEISS
jgi:hypothetical protein